MKLNIDQKLEQCLTVAKQVYGVDPQEKVGTTLHCWARTAVYVELRKTEATFGLIGSFFNRNHATVMHHLNKHETAIKYDKEYLLFYQKFKLKMSSPIIQENAVKKDIRVKVLELTAQLQELKLSQYEILEFWEECINEVKLSKTA